MTFKPRPEPEPDHPHVQVGMTEVVLSRTHGALLMKEVDLSVDNIKLSFNVLPVDVRTIEVEMTYRGTEVRLVIPAVHLRDGIDPYYEQAEAFFRAAADEVARYRKEQKAPGYPGS